MPESFFRPDLKMRSYQTSRAADVFSICRRNESGEIEIIGQIENRIGASFTINAPGSYFLGTIDRTFTPSQTVIDSATIAPNQELSEDEIAFLQQPLTWEEDEPQL